MIRNIFKFSFILSLVIFTTGCISLSGSGSDTSGPAGVFISQDKGEEWKPISFVPTVNGNKNFSAASVFRLKGDYQDSKSIYWLSRDRGLLFSYDEGRSWQQSGEPLEQGFIYGMDLHPKDACTIFATNGRTVYKSVNCARTWEAMYKEGRPSTIVRSVAFDPFGDHNVYILTNTGDVIKSVDQGVSWTTLSRFKTESVKLVFDKNREGLVYVTNENKGLFRSYNGGEDWKIITNSIKKKAGILTYRGFYVYPSEPNHIYWISKHGIMKSKNAGEDWDNIELITPPGGAQIYAFTVNPTNDQDIYYTATIGSKSTLYRSEDGGKSWVTKRLPSGQIPTALYTHPENGDWVYLGFTIPPKS